MTDRPVSAVFEYLGDFSTTTRWDPNTVDTVRHSGDGGVGTVYVNTSRFLGRTTQLTYVVQEFDPPHRIRLRGENQSVVAVDTMMVHPTPAGTRVTYTAEFRLKGAGRLAVPLLLPAFTRLADRAEAGLRAALREL